MICDSPKPLIPLSKSSGLPHTISTNPISSLYKALIHSPVFLFSRYFIASLGFFSNCLYIGPNSPVSISFFFIFLFPLFPIGLPKAALLFSCGMPPECLWLTFGTPPANRRTALGLHCKNTCKNPNKNEGELKNVIRESSL